MQGRNAGAASLVLSLLMGIIAVGGLGGVDVAAAVAAQGHAESAADAVAHAVTGLLASDPEREHLSVTTQAGSLCDTQATPPPGADVRSCTRAIALARDVASRNRAVLLRLLVGPDLRDLGPLRGAGRLQVLAEVAVRRAMPAVPVRCAGDRPQGDHDLCWAVAWSAGREAG